MRIRYLGSRVVRRVIGQHEWSAATDFVQDVEARLAVELLTERRSSFEVDPSEPLLALPGVNAEKAGELALAGIGSLADLAALGSQGIKGLAGVLPWASESKIKQWVRQVRGETAEPEPQEKCPEVKDE